MTTKLCQNYAISFIAKNVTMERLKKAASQVIIRANDIKTTKTTTKTTAFQRNYAKCIPVKNVINFTMIELVYGDTTKNAHN